MAASPLKSQWRLAAEKIAAADFLLIAAGAGFSADSSLPVYADIAKVPAYEQMGVEYQDLCDPYMLAEDDEIFYGFWGNCVNSYRDSKHHRGYSILSKWRSMVAGKPATTQEAIRSTFLRLKLAGALPAGVNVDSVTDVPFFVYTSNVDAHFHREFERNEVYEVHGNVEHWQCAGDPETNARSPCDGSSASATSCRLCGEHGRPNVLMFHDRQWIPNVKEEHTYIAWEAVMEQMMEENPSLNLVVVEIGCGTRVPSVRKECEMVVADTLERCGGQPRATLLRINPDFPGCDHPAIMSNGLLISVAAKGLDALEAIDQELATM